ncbi:MAG: hypothetical protein Ct9H300mP18_11350 [Candidatus Neomarinimicrobiota bacterium]|nr:MAG: hypothetical protein Ct9H300mP18_11350 [Candidatus Neomarinimicrobiota bacterium]
MLLLLLQTETSEVVVHGCTFKNGKTFSLDYREMAPSKAHRDFYLDENRDVIENKSLFGHFASGVPGSVDGLLMAWEDPGPV